MAALIELDNNITTLKDLFEENLSDDFMKGANVFQGLIKDEIMRTDEKILNPCKGFNDRFGQAKNEFRDAVESFEDKNKIKNQKE